MFGLLNRRSRLPRTLIGALLVLALVYRAMIPTGFMPVTDARGVKQMVFCHGVAPADPSAPHAGAKAHDSVCAFAASPPPAPYAGFSVTPQPAMVASRAPATAVPVGITRSIPRHSSPRGPPTDA
jgi:hypothetical protein